MTIPWLYIEFRRSNSAAYNTIVAILSGPKLQREQFDMLLRFCRNSVALVCDVKEMYLQIEIHPDDRKHLRFLWRTQDEVNVYQFNRLVFGLNISPLIAHYVIQNHARQHAVTHPRGAEAVLESTYINDTLDSVESDEKAVELYHQLSFVWSTAGMKAEQLAYSPAERSAGRPAIINRLVRRATNNQDAWCTVAA